jgi:hypothetical protein
VTDPVPPDPDAARAEVRAMARASIERGDPMGWFERLYAESGGEAAAITWGDLGPNPGLTAWLARERIEGAGRDAAVVGCGLGDDAQAIAGAGFRVTGFDLAPTAITWARRRFPSEAIRFEVADLLAPPGGWAGRFAFVFEAYTLQAVPADVRRRMLAPLASLVAPGGTLLVVTRGREPSDPEGLLPWPLTKADLAPLETGSLKLKQFEDYLDDEQPPLRRFRVEYRRPPA